MDAEHPRLASSPGRSLARSGARGRVRRMPMRWVRLTVHRGGGAPRVLRAGASETSRSTLKIALDAYARHRPNLGGWCACGSPVCLVAQYAARYIRGCGYKPARPVSNPVLTGVRVGRRTMPQARAIRRRP